jgi:AcrR family transcriptional regulator
MLGPSMATPKHAVKRTRGRAAKRKQRSANPDNNAREPTQTRSRLRFEAILNATDELLQYSNIENISLYDIAARSRMPAASVHYLFPTVDAVYVKLVERYIEQFAAASAQSRSERRAQTWQENVRSGLERACRQGSSGGHPVRELDPSHQTPPQSIDYLNFAGLTLVGWRWLRMADVAKKALDGGQRGAGLLRREAGCGSVLLRSPPAAGGSPRRGAGGGSRSRACGGEGEPAGLNRTVGPGGAK